MPAVLCEAGEWAGEPAAEDIGVVLGDACFLGGCGNLGFTGSTGGPVLLAALMTLNIQNLIYCLLQLTNLSLG